MHFPKLSLALLLILTAAHPAAAGIHDFHFHEILEEGKLSDGWGGITGVKAVEDANMPGVTAIVRDGSGGSANLLFNANPAGSYDSRSEGRVITLMLKVRFDDSDQAWNNLIGITFDQGSAAAFNISIQNGKVKAAYPSLKYQQEAEVPEPFPPYRYVPVVIVWKVGEKDYPTSPYAIAVNGRTVLAGEIGPADKWQTRQIQIGHRGQRNIYISEVICTTHDILGPQSAISVLTDGK